MRDIKYHAFPTSILTNAITEAVLAGKSGIIKVNKGLHISIPEYPAQVRLKLTQLMYLATLSMLAEKGATHTVITPEDFKSYWLEGVRVERALKPVLEWISKIYYIDDQGEVHQVIYTEKVAPKKYLVKYATDEEIIRKSIQPLPLKLSKMPYPAVTVYILNQVSYHRGNNRLGGQELKVSHIIDRLGYTPETMTKNRARLEKALSEIAEYCTDELHISGLEALKPAVKLRKYYESAKVNIAVMPYGHTAQALQWAANTTPVEYWDFIEPELRLAQ